MKIIKYQNSRDNNNINVVIKIKLINMMRVESQRFFSFFASIN